MCFFWATYNLVLCFHIICNLSFDLRLKTTLTAIKVFADTYHGNIAPMLTPFYFPFVRFILCFGLLGNVDLTVPVQDSPVYFLQAGLVVINQCWY